MGVEPEWQSRLAWRKSRYSADQVNCVEVSSTRSFVLVRDSDDHTGGVIRITPTQWYLLLGRIQRDDLDSD